MGPSLTDMLVYLSQLLPDPPGEAPGSQPGLPGVLGR